MTAKVHKKCRFYNNFENKCNLTQAKLSPWDDACASYDLKDEFKFIPKVKADGT